jgi:CubicO group peptidase (beta-lactamase class C family)
MLARFLRRTGRLAATALAALNVPRPPRRPASLHGDWQYFQRYMRWYIGRGLRKNGVPGLSLALVSDRQVIWAEGFGYADREQKRPAAPDTVYQIGSITKLLNAVLCMQFVEQGRLQLDRPFNDYLPAFSMRTRWPHARPITPRALLCHHAGLPTYLLKGFFSDQSLTALLEQLRDEHLAYEPHTVFNYSNLGPDLLGLALEHLAGRPYAELLNEHLLAPLAMRRSGFALQGEIAANLARGYVHDTPVAPTPIRDAPAGGLYSSVLDLAQFMRCVLSGGALDDRRLLGENALGMMFEPQYADRPLNFGHHFGLGWMLSGLPIENGGRQAWHNGGTKAFLSQLALLPDRNLGVVVLANSDNAGALVYETAEEALRLALETRHGIAQPARVLEPEISLPRRELAKRVGDYSLMGSLARISLGRKRLRLHVLQHVLDLVPTTSNRFRVEFNLLGIKSVPISFPPVEFASAEGREFAVLRDRVAVPAEKIPSYVIPDSWRRFTGSYHLLNPDTEYLVDLEHCRMQIENGKLLMDIRISGIENREVKVVIVPLNEHEVYVFGLGRNVGDVSRAFVENGHIRMRFSGYLFEREQD